jgi:hypothetical protein
MILERRAQGFDFWTRESIPICARTIRLNFDNKDGETVRDTRKKMIDTKKL